MANKDTWNKWIKSSLILSCLLIAFVKSEYYWKQIIGLVPLIFKIIVVLFAIAVITMLIISSIRIYKESGKLNLRMFIPVMVYFFGLAFSFADPFSFNAESFQSRVVLKGHYKALINSGIITFRENGNVEFEGEGFLGYTFFYKGKWTHNLDTINTIFNDEVSIPWGNQLILYEEDKLLLPIDTVAESKQFPGFLLDDGFIDSEYFQRSEILSRI